MDYLKNMDYLKTIEKHNFISVKIAIMLMTGCGNSNGSHEVIAITFNCATCLTIQQLALSMRLIQTGPNLKTCHNS